MRDHPRVRGEQMHGRNCEPPSEGSSPRARGAAGREHQHPPLAGIIPACAGSRSRLRRVGSRPRDHPRVRGEQARSASDGSASRGSSPRARGAAHPRRPAAHDPGIIPACAGSRVSSRPTYPERPDHPRVRGEQSLTLSRGSILIGSSPRARGAVGDQRHQAGQRGIIPACAGSRSQRGPDQRAVQDHPRVRGEQRWVMSSNERPQGSSPRARGAERATAGPPADVRIIPACAGSRSRRACCPRRKRDHPRVRGEQRVRHDYLPPGLGIIPACAGSRLTVVAGLFTRLGSSPRARGAAGPSLRPRQQPGIIPACAGSSGRPASGFPRSGGSSPRARGAAGDRIWVPA